MWLQAFFATLSILTIQITNPAEGRLFEKTLATLTNINSAWEACNKVGDDGDILDGMRQILNTQLQLISRSMEEKVSKEDWEKLLESDAEEEVELLSNYGIQDTITQALDTVMLLLAEYCQANDNGEDTGIIPWDDTEAFGRDMVGTLFQVWGTDEDVDPDEYSL